MTKLEMMKIILANTKHYYDVSTPFLLDIVARKHVNYYKKSQLEEMVNNLDHVGLGIKIH